MIRMPWMRKASSSSEILGGLAKFMSPGGGRARMGTQVHNRKKQELI